MSSPVALVNVCVNWRAWAANTRECLAVLLRPGNAEPDASADHREVLAAGRTGCGGSPAGSSRPADI